MSHFSFFLALLHDGSDALDLADVGRDWIGFLGLFCIMGAISFRLLVLGRVAKWDRGGLDAGPRSVVFQRAARYAATVGAMGAVLVALAFISNIMESASEGGAGAHIQRWTIILLSMALFLAAAGFVIARLTAHRNGSIGWCVAYIGVLYFVLSGAIQALVRGRWSGIINPLHIVGGSVWLGTLFVLVVAGIPALLHRETAHAYRGPLVADFVNAFSPVALWSASLLGVTGIITAWRHLKYLSALWTTSYGETLVVKLCLVAVVLGLGAWNWRRVRPLLGDESAARAMRRSAAMELAFGAVVLIVTAVLVNLPVPKIPIPVVHQ